MPSFEGNIFTQQHKICSQEIRDPALSYSENPKSLGLSDLGLVWYYPVVTDIQTDRIRIASTRLSLRAVVRKKTVELQIASGASRHRTVRQTVRPTGLYSFVAKDVLKILALRSRLMPNIAAY